MPTLVDLNTLNAQLHTSAVAAAAALVAKDAQNPAVALSTQNRADALAGAVRAEAALAAITAAGGGSAPSPTTTIVSESFEANLGSFTAVGAATRTTSSPIAGVGSLALGAGGYLTRAGLDLGVKDWKIKLKIRHPGQPAVYTCLFAQRNAGNTSNSDYDFQLYFQGFSNLWFSEQGRPDVGGAIPQPGYADNAIHLVEIECVGQVVSVKFDGVVIGQPMTDSIAMPGAGRTFTLGGDPSVTDALYFENGLIDDFEVVVKN